MTASAMFDSKGRRPEGAGHVSYVVAGVAVLDHIEIFVVPDYRLSPNLQTDKTLPNSLFLDPDECVLPDEVILAQVHLPAKPDLIRIVLDVHVLTVRQDARLQPADVAGGDDAQVELLPLLQDVRPDVVRIEHGVVQVDLKPDLGGEARAEIVTAWPFSVS